MDLEHRNRKTAGAGRSESDRTAATATCAAVVATGLVKDFRSPFTRKRRRAVDGLSLTIERGEIFGLLGPNGAGKTTTLKMLLGLLRPTAGAAWLLGTPAGTPESRRGIGYLPERPAFFDRLTGAEFLTFSGQLAGLSGGDARRRASAWLERLGISASAKVPLRKYSKGMLQRVGLAHALLAEPELVFLDEPMSGLDPAGRREFRDVILDCRRRGVTVVFSSHILPDAEMLCDRVAVVRSGQVVRIGTLDELLAERVSEVEVVVKGPEPLLLPPRFAAIRQRSHGEYVELHVADPELVQEMVPHLISKGYELVALQTRRRSLESVVLECTEGPELRAEPMPDVERAVYGKGRRAG
jgi:ABC-2 type transport system ATP-binding protein